MKNWIVLSVFAACLGMPAWARAKPKLDYGQFSVSLKVKDIQKSLERINMPDAEGTQRRHQSVRRQ